MFGQVTPRVRATPVVNDQCRLPMMTESAGRACSSAGVRGKTTSETPSPTLAAGSAMSPSSRMNGRPGPVRYQCCFRRHRLTAIR
eukprot:4687329-Pyramimonas_sp.AAC.1